MARTGKIARLSAEIRHRLNRRLQDGEPAKTILEGLHGEEDVQHTLKCLFKGAPITEQNLSEWRKGGYQEWLRHQEALDVLRDLDKEAEGIFAAADERPVSELLAAKVSVAFARHTLAMLEQETDPKERWQRLEELLPHLARIRRADHRAQRLQMNLEGWEWKREDRDKRKAINKEWQDNFAALMSPSPLAKLATAAGLAEKQPSVELIRPNPTKSK